MHSSVAAPEADVELAVRNERGARAMKLPDRVAEVFGVENETLKAPVRDEQRELAGLVLLPPRHVDETVLSPSDPLLSGDVLAADRNREGRNDRGRIERLVQARCKVFAIGITLNRQSICQHSLAPSGRNRRNQKPLFSILRRCPRPSLLAASNRALGKRMLMQPQVEDVRLRQK